MKKTLIRRSTLMAVFVLAAASFSGTVDRENKPVFTTMKIDRPLQITGKLDDPLWLKAVPVYLTYEIQPGDNLPAPQRTMAFTLYDQENLYFGFRCYDTNQDEIRANRSDRDKIFQDDWILVILDTYGDCQKGYELAVNPFGVQGDLMMTSNNEDDGFDLVWHSAAVRTDSGWTAELAIPFKSLRFSSKETQEWSVALIRNFPRSSRHQLSWTTYDRNNPSLLNQLGKLQGLQGIKASGTFEVLPYVLGEQVGSFADWSNPSAGLANDPVKGRVGGGIAYSPGPTMSFDGVINPDFSQIETDADQISINTTFALNYPEKRPFFLIGQDLWQTHMYYSRSINNPLAAGRIIGKVGALSYSVLSAWDRNTTFIVPGEEGSNTVISNRESMANIGRFRYDFGDETYVGGMAMGRNISEGHNYLAGVDWNYKFLKNNYFSGEIFYTHTKELNDSLLLDSDRAFGSTGHDAGLNGEQYAGTGLEVGLRHNDRLYHCSVYYDEFSPTYQAYNGIFSQVDYRILQLHNGFTVYPKNTFIDQASSCITGYMRYNFDGMKKEQVIQPNLSLTMKGQTNVSLSYMLANDENFHGMWFKGIHRANLRINARPAKAFSFSFQGSFGNYIFRTDVPEMGTGHDIWAEVQFRPTSKFSISFDYSRAGLRSKATDDLLYDGNIYRSVWLYQFSNAAFIRLIGQYNTFDKAFNFYPLFSYKLNVFTTFYAGMTNDWLDFGMPTGYRTTGRQFFVKMQYLFRT